MDHRDTGYSYESNISLCDVSLAFPYDRFQIGCLLYRYLFLFLYFGITVLCIKRLIYLFDNKISPIFIGLVQLGSSTLIGVIRHILLICQVENKTIMGLLLMLFTGFQISSFLWILYMWAESIKTLNISDRVNRILPIIKYFILFMNAVLFIGIIIGIIIYWKSIVTNIWGIAYFGSEIICFLIFYYFIKEDYNKFELKNPLDVTSHRKMTKIKKFVIWSCISCSIAATQIILGIIWKPKSNLENGCWLLLSRIIGVIAILCLLKCLKVPKQSAQNLPLWILKIESSIKRFLSPTKPDPIGNPEN